MNAEQKTMRNNQGFTLIETIMVITLLGIVAAIIAIPLSQGVKGWFQATSREGISQSGRIAIERMAREIRNTARTAANNPCISTATATSFSFSDLSGDLTNCNSITFCVSSNQITCAIAGSYLLRTDASATAVLADNIQNPPLFTLFTYYDGNNAPTAVATNIRRLSIEIVSTQGGEIVRKYNEVYLSNMKGY